MKSSLKILLISTIAFILLFASVIVVKKVFVDKSSNDLVNINHLSSKFINKYLAGYQELNELDNKENILIVTSKKELKETYGAIKVVEAPNYQYFLQYEDEEAKEYAKSKLENNEDIIYVEENIVRNIKSSSSKTLSEEELDISWGIEKMGLDKAVESLNSKELEEVVVAMIDSGINLELFNNKYKGKIKETYNVLNNSEDISIENEYELHGNMIAGIIAESTPDNVKLLPVKADDGFFATSIDFITAINYITINKKADVINLGYGSYDQEYTLTEYQAIEAATENKIVCVSASGNDLISGPTLEQDYYDNSYAPYNNTLSIEAVDSNLEIYEGSMEYEDKRNKVDFSAPGVNISSLGYTQTSTSMAAAHVSSVVAILKSYNKNINLENTKKILKNYTLDLGKEGYDEVYGNGFISLSNIEFCDGRNCDEYNIFKNSKEDIVNIVVPETYVLKYDYLTNTNISNLEVKFYYTEDDYYTKQLWELKDAVIENYDPTLKEDQEIKIKYNNLEFNVLIDYTDETILGWEYEKLQNPNNSDLTIDYIISLTKINIDEEKPLKNVIVPSTIDGNTVTIIGKNLFSGNEDIVEVELPNTIEIIGESSFNKSSAKVVIPNSVKEIQTGAFAEYKVKSINIPNSVTKIGDSAFYYSDIEEITLSESLEKINFGTFWGSKIKRIEIPSSVKEIGQYAFIFCSNLEEIVLNEGLEKISTMAIDEIPIEKLHIPSTVIEIESRAIYSLKNLKTITVSEENPKYYTEEFSNTIIEKDTNRLVYANKYSKIPNNVDIIGKKSYDPIIYEITLPEGVETIEEQAFSNIYSSNLKKVQLPKSITTIADGVFSSFENLTLYVYKDSYALEYAITNEIPYKVIGYKEVSINKEGLKINYKAFESVDPTNLKVSVFFDDGSGGLTEEVVTEGLTIEYQNGTDSFRYGDTYFIVKGATENKAEFEIIVDVNIAKADASRHILDLTLIPYFQYDGKPHGLTLNISTNNYEPFVVKFANEDGEYVLDKSPEYTEIGEYLVKYKVYFVNEDYTPNENYTPFYNEYVLGIMKAELTPKITIPDKIYDGTNNIDLASIDAVINELEKEDYTIVDAKTTTPEVGQTTAKVTMKLSDEAFRRYAFEGELQEKEYTVNMNILPQPVTKPTMVEKVYTYTGEEQTLELNNFNADKMNIEGNIQTNAGEHNVIVSLKNNNYIWEDETTDNVVLKYVINKLNIEDYITDNTEDDYTLYDNTPKKIWLDIQSDLEYNIKFANEAGEYVLDESPEYTEEGTYIIKYKVYIDENYTEYFNEIEFTITKLIYIPTVTIIKDKIYDGTNDIDLSSINIECDGLQEGDIIIESANTTTTEVGKTQARVVIKLRDELAVSYDLDQKELMLDINILPQPVTKPTMIEKVYTYTGEQQTLELNNFNADKMNIEGNVQTNAGEHNVTISLKNNNYIWEDETTDNVVLKYVINKRDINDCIIDNTLTPLILHDGQSHGLNLNIVSELEYVVKFANEAGEYVLDESPKYSEVGDYTIKYKVYINDNYTEYLNEKVLTITDDTIIDNTKDKEVLYDGKEHTLDIKLNIEDYEVKYSTDNQNYSTEVPKFKHVGEYNVYYKILVDDEEVITGNKKVKIYGVQKIANNIRIKENIIITKNNSFSNLISNFTIYAPHHTKGHYDNNNGLITKDVLKTTDTLVIKLTNFGQIKYNIALLGDINSDSKINSADYIKIKKHIMETEKIKENINFYAADVNNDNDISSKDYIKIRKYIMNGESL